MIPPRPRDVHRGRLPGAWWTSRDRSHVLRRLSRLLSLQRAPLTPYLLALAAGRALERTSGVEMPPGRGPVAVVIYRGHATLLGPFLAHHRALGVERFVFLDLSEGDGLALAGADDCAVWRPRAPLRAVADERATLWSDYLRHRYASGRWCLSLDACEFLVFPRCETRSLASLVDFLHTEHRDHLYALVIEMYGDGAGLGAALAAGRSPFEAAPFFDPIGVLAGDPLPDGSVPTLGGVRRRTLFRAVPGKAPRLDRIPLVRWRRRFNYVEGTSVLRPKRLNTPHAPWHSSPTACLLRFSPGGELGGSPMTEASRRYTGSDDLVECGLLNPGQWF